MLRRVILQVVGFQLVGFRLVWRRRVGLLEIGPRGKDATMKVEQAVAAGSAVGEVGFNALIVHFQIVNFQIVSFQIVNLPTFSLLILNWPILNLPTVNLPIVNSLIANWPVIHWPISNFLIIDARMIGALRLVTLGRLRSRTGSPNPVVFNLSTAQMLRLFSHWTHISLI